MKYILVNPRVLRDHGIKYFETVPDGRAIASISMLKVLGDIDNAQIVSSDEKLNEIIEGGKINE